MVKDSNSATSDVWMEMAIFMTRQNVTRVQNLWILRLVYREPVVTGHQKTLERCVSFAIHVDDPTKSNMQFMAFDNEIPGINV